MKLGSRGAGIGTVAILFFAAFAAKSAILPNCKLIDCDCETLDWGILTGPYKDRCRAVEAQVKANCQAGKDADACDLEAHGDNAFQ